MFLSMRKRIAAFQYALSYNTGVDRKVIESANIIQEKVNEICDLIPAFRNEIKWERGKSREGKDYVKYIFKNGSYFDNLAATERTRGARRHAGLLEECVGIDGDILNEVLIPTMNVSRMCLDGTTHPEEQLNKSQIYIKFLGQNVTFYLRHFLYLVKRSVKNVLYLQN